MLGIVRGHRGALKVYSEPGRGSTFKLLLPAANAAADPAITSATAAIEWRGTGTVLVVDDDADVRAVATRILERRDFSVLTATEEQRPDGERPTMKDERPLNRVRHSSLVVRRECLSERYLV